MNEWKCRFWELEMVYITVLDRVLLIMQNNRERSGMQSVSVQNPTPSSIDSLLPAQLISSHI